MHGTRNASHTYQKKHAVGLLLLKITTAITHTVTKVERAWQATESTNTPHCSAAFICCTPARHKQRSVRSTLANSEDKALAPHDRIASQHTKFVANCMWAQMLHSRRWPKIPTPQWRPARCVATPSRRRWAVRRRRSSHRS